jgi:hypothetical protein
MAEETGLELCPFLKNLNTYGEFKKLESSVYNPFTFIALIDKP